MNIEELIHKHNETLQQRAEADPFLNQRIKARLRDGSKQALPGRLFLFKTPLVRVLLLLIVFTIINFLVITGLDKPKPPLPRHNDSNIIAANILQPVYPGSISHAYGEVMK